MHQHENWSSRTGFLLAAIGAAVGLGNIWKFPYMLGSNGGAAFVIIYLATIFLIATPVMMGEMLIGRRAKMSAPKSLEAVAVEEGKSPAWRYLGWWGIGALFFVLSFFSVIAGWAIAFIFKTATGEFSGLGAEDVGGAFNDFLHQPGVLIAWHALFMAFTVFVVSRGIKGGIEKAVTFLMPALFAMMVGLVIYGMIAGDFGQAFKFLFTPDFSKVDTEVALAAIGQAFFSVNVGIGALLTYAAYLPKEINLTRSAIVIAIGDTLVALLAGLMIFPIVFQYGLSPAEGPGLIFVTLATAFGAMPAGQFVGTVFFTLVFFAALTSSLSMLEIITCRFIEFKNGNRTNVTIGVGLICFFLGFLTVFSFNIWEEKTFFDGKTVFGVIDYLVTNIMLPVGAFFYALFIGWFVSKKLAKEELQLKEGAVLAGWRFLMRYVTPIVIIAIFVSSIV